MSTVSFRSLSAPTMRSAVLTWPTRISTFAKSSIPIFSAGPAGALRQPLQLPYQHEQWLPEQPQEPLVSG